MPIIQSMKDYIKSNLYLPRTEPLIANYADIGGNPDYYPQPSVSDVHNQFCANLDYKDTKSRSASRERFSDSNAKRIDQDLRSTAIAESISQQRSAYNKAELDGFLQACKIKKTILKERVTSAEIRLRELQRYHNVQKHLESKSEYFRPETTNYKWFKKLTVPSNTRIPSDEDKLRQIKQDRAVQNHNLNNLRQKIERLRVTEGQLLKQAGHLGKQENNLNLRLHLYENLVRENLALKSKLQKASIVLQS